MRQTKVIEVSNLYAQKNTYFLVVSGLELIFLFGQPAQQLRRDLRPELKNNIRAVLTAVCADEAEKKEGGGRSAVRSVMRRGGGFLSS